MCEQELRLGFTQQTVELCVSADVVLQRCEKEHRKSVEGLVEEAHCCDTSRSLQFLIGGHSKATSSEQGCKPTLVKNSYTDQMCKYSYQLNLLHFLVPCDTCGMRTEYRILTLKGTEYTWQIYTHREGMERPDIALLQSL